MINLLSNRLHYYLSIIFVFILFLTPLSGYLDNAEQTAEKTAMQKAIGNLSDWKSVPDAKIKLSSFGSNVRLPQLKFMRQLFESADNRSVLGSTIRSFRPTITSLPPCEELHGLDFNLNSLKPTDILLSAEMHYENRLKSDPYKLAGFKNSYAKQYQLEVVKSCGQAIVHEAHSKSQNQWTSFDLKNSVEKMMQKNSTHLFIRVLQRGSPLSLKQLVRFLRHHSPFLTTTTTSSVSNMPPNFQFIQQDQPTSLQRSKREVGSAEPFSHHRRRYQRRKIVRQVGAPSYYSYDIRDEAAKQTDENRSYNNKSWLSSNQQPKLKAQFQTFKTVGPKMLTSRKQKNKSRRPKLRYDPADPMMGFGRMDDEIETSKSNLLPFPKKLRAEETSDEVREFNVNTDDRSQGNDVTLVLLDQQKEKQTISRRKCQKHSLKINFRDIGWDKWIIAPESFEAGYCDGSCSYPFEEDGHPSNHAILQSILRTTSNQYSHLPQACCAPDATDSLTLLYYDENENVVLKNYPKMLITSCGCM